MWSAKCGLALCFRNRNCTMVLKAGRFRLKASGMLKFYCKDEVLGFRLYLRSKLLSPSGLWSKAYWVFSWKSKLLTCRFYKTTNLVKSLLPSHGCIPTILPGILSRGVFSTNHNPTQQLLTPVCPQQRLGVDRVPLQCLCIEHKKHWYTLGVRLRGQQGRI